MLSYIETIIANHPAETITIPADAVTIPADAVTIPASARGTVHLRHILPAQFWISRYTLPVLL